MCKVEFDKETAIFSVTKGFETVPYQYVPDCKNVWVPLCNDDFVVVVLNNPFLHRESDFFEVKFDGSDERGAFLYPIELLESEEAEGKQLLSYMFVSYGTLLERIEGELSGILSDSFKDAFVLVVHKSTVPDFRLSDYLLSLASNGFYTYHGAIRSEFPTLPTIINHTKTLLLSKCVVDNIGCGYVKELIESRLVVTSDFLTRFILVYQVVEMYISEIHNKLLDEAIENYKRDELSRNDFGEELKNISREGYQIECLMKGVDTIEECMTYKSDVLGLFNEVGYKPKKESIDTLIYALRNQIFHNYGIFVGHEDLLNQVIFSFERVVLHLLSKKLVGGGAGDNFGSRSMING